MREIHFDCTQFTDKETFHQLIYTQLEIQDVYGGNLDALHDVLTCLTEDTCLYFHKMKEARMNLGSYLNGLYMVFEDCIDENPHLQVFVCN